MFLKAVINLANVETMRCLAQLKTAVKSEQGCTLKGGLIGLSEDSKNIFDYNVSVRITNNIE